MEKNYFDNDPQLVSNEGSDILICFDVEHTTEERIPMGGGKPELVEVIKAYAVRVPHPIDRGKIIDAIVTAMYPADKMQAVVNNYLLDPTDDEREDEMEAMQDWRAKAKQVATEVMETVSNE